MKRLEVNTAVLDGVVGVGHGVELLVALLDAGAGSAPRRPRWRRNLHSLGAALERAVLFDLTCRYSPAWWRRCTGSRRATGRFEKLAASSEPSAEPAPTSVCSSSMKMMALLVLHQLLHDGLQALFELASVLGSRHDQRESRARMRLSARNDGTSPSEMRWARLPTMAVFPYSRLADQHRLFLSCGTGSEPRARARSRGRSGDRASRPAPIASDRG